MSKMRDMRKSVFVSKFVDRSDSDSDNKTRQIKRKMDIYAYDIIIPNGNIVHLAVAAPMYNGKYGMIVKWSERFDATGDTSFYDVQLSASKTIRVKMANVRL